MKVTRNAHTKDVIELTRQELNEMLKGYIFEDSGTQVKMEIKPDIVKTAAISALPLHDSLQLTLGVGGNNVRFVFDGDTYALKHVELIK